MFNKSIAPFMAFCAILFVAGCATSTTYSSAEGSGYGYSEQRIENDRYRIVFKGNSLTSREQVEDYLLFRAAEVTLEAGFDHFIVVEDDTEKTTRYSSTSGPRFYSYYGYGRRFPYYGFGYRWDPFYDDVELIERNRYTAMAYILMGKGPKPAGEPTAYNAAEVVENLQERIIRPEPTS